MSSGGESSYIATSSSTTSRSWSRSAKVGRATISAMTSNALSRSSSRSRALTSVCSLEVDALGSAPMSSKMCAMSDAEYLSEPLKIRCSMKWEMPPSSTGSSREPAAIQTPRATERTLSMRSVATRRPFSSVDRR